MSDRCQITTYNSTIWYHTILALRVPIYYDFLTNVSSFTNNNSNTWPMFYWTVNYSSIIFPLLPPVSLSYPWYMIYNIKCLIYAYNWPSFSFWIQPVNELCSCLGRRAPHKLIKWDIIRVKLQKLVICWPWCFKSFLFLARPKVLLLLMVAFSTWISA